MSGINELARDGSEWELDKENVQPIKRGRKIPNLMMALASNSEEDAHWKLQREKKNFEAEIRTYDGDDPLDVWYRYILWIEENVPKGGCEISILLERCIKDFKDIAKYRCDERYLFIWLKYADCCSDPLEIFNYMYSQKISPMHAQFYMAWASACENAESYQKADEVITLGIERKAKPEDVLKKYHIGFQHRLTSRIASGDDSAGSCEALGISRTTLGELKSSKKKNVGVMRASNVRKTPTGLNKSSGFGNTNSVGQAFSVHHDCDMENKPPRLPCSDGSWKEPPMQSSITKENENMPGKWTNNDKPSSRRGHSNLPLVGPAPSKQSFQIHVEENAVQTAYVAHHSIGNQVLTARKPERGDSNDPLKVIAQDQNENKDQAKIKVMYDKSKVYTGTEEFQFEEIRAARYSALVRQGQPLPREIRRRKRQQESEGDYGKEKREKVMYPKEEVYALEGEFQPEEIMARRYYAQGRRLRPKSKQIRNNEEELKICDENINTSRRGRVGKARPLQEKPIDFQSDPVQNTNDTLKRDNIENMPNDDKENCLPSLVVSTQRQALKALTTTPLKNQQRNSDVPQSTEKTPRMYKDRFVSNLAGPSPTLTTKQAFAEVMPWFNTTVGSDDSDAEFEAKFKNDAATENNDLFSTVFGAKSDFASVKNKPDGVYQFNDDDGNEDEENVPPAGYTQPILKTRPIAGILQPSVDIPVEPLKDPCDDDDDDDDDLNFRQAVADDLATISNNSPVKQERLKVDHCNEEVTQFQDMGHLQFATAARLASTPFGEQGDSRYLPTFHCSTIHPSEGNDENEEPPAESRPTDEPERPPTNMSASQFSTPSKVLSPIFECSDEDNKTTSSHGASSHGTTSSSSTTTSVAWHHDTVPADGTTTNGGGNVTRLERSLDITVHGANGDILQIVNPFDPIVCRGLLSKLPLPVTDYPGYHDLKHKVIPKIAAQKTVDLGGELYNIGEMIGTGAFGKVYLANCLNRPSVALKIQSLANEWEFYVCRELVKRLRSSGKTEQELSMIVNIDDFYVYNDASCCVSKYHEKGTFLDLVNYYKGGKGFLKEYLPCYYAVQLLRILQSIHDCGIIHGDIKPDNILLLGNISPDITQPSIALIDLGCAIDCTLFPAGTRFTVEKSTESFECIEMKAGKPWTTQVDTYGMLCTLHCLIFGEYMKVYQDTKSNEWKITKVFDRSWNRKLWGSLFNVFLNIPSCDELPSIQNMLEEFERYFEQSLRSNFQFHVKKQELGFR